MHYKAPIHVSICHKRVLLLGITVGGMETGREEMMGSAGGGTRKLSNLKLTKSLTSLYGRKVFGTDTSPYSDTGS